MSASSSTTTKVIRNLRSRRSPTFICRQCRGIQISATPSSQGDSLRGAIESDRDAADARFEVLGSPNSLLSVTLAASQRLYTRRGTLVGVAGKPDSAQSTLSVLNPLTRVAFGVPFLYQRITATSPITALIAAKTPTTTFSVLHLDGTTDWMISQRNALLAWTGHTLSISSRIQRRLSLVHWGSTHLTGRGVAALSAPGQIYQLSLKEGEEFVAHPGSVVAYSISRNLPQPFRFKSSSLRLQIPSLTRWLPNSDFINTMRKTETYRFLSRTLQGLRTMTRRTIWGDRLFLHFKGPATLLMSSRGVRLADVLTSEQINEVAQAPAGEVQRAVGIGSDPVEGQVVLPSPNSTQQAPSAMHVASVRRDGKVTFEDSKDLKDFVR